MKKKLWSIVSIALLFVGLICFLKANAEESQVLTGTYGDTVTWEFDTATGAMTISGTGFFSPDSIWEQIDKSQVTSLTIEEGVSSFVRYAFRNCTNLSYVVLPKGFTSIPECAFEGCSSLSSIALPEGINDIGHSAFMGCSNLSNIDIPESVTYIDAYAFYNCSSLNAVSIPEGVTSIGDYTFWNCNNLNTVSIPESVTSIGAFVFEECDKLNSIDLPNGLSSIGNYAFRNCMSVTSMQISESVISIGNGAFSGCSSLTGIWVDENNANYSCDASGVLFNKDKTEFVCVPPAISGEYVIPETITAIGWNTFINCHKLNSVVISANVTTISPYFGNSLTGIWVDENNANYSSDLRGVLFNKDKTTLIYAPGAINGRYEVPQSVTTIASNAFAYCKELSEVIIPEGVISIEENAFEGCSSLNNVVIPEGITIIPDYAFIDCSDLSNIVLPNSLTEIRTAAFSGCTKLSSIVIPGNVTLIGNGAFIYCNLSKVTIPANVTTIGTAAFSDSPDLSEIRFEGDAPAFSSTAFVGETKPVTATVYYPAMNETWNAETMLNYGGDLTWVPYYDVLEDSDLTWINLEGGDLSISVHAPYLEFAGVQIDENSLTADHFTVSESENGTVVIISEEYLMSLEGEGNSHSIVISFVKGDASAVLDIVFEEEFTTEEPTTEEPTTEEPTTEEPTTEKPTTEEPTTEEPTTEEPTTEEPATEEPTTEESTTEEPTTEEPTTEEPTTEEPNTEEPTTEEPTTEEHTTEEPTTEEPTTEDSVESDEFPTTEKSDGWIEIKDELEQIKVGEILYVEMNGANIVPSDIVNMVAGKDVQISFDMGNGFIWKVNGKDITADSEQTDLNLGIYGDTEIAKELIEELANGQDVKEIQLFHNGEFGFKLYLNVALGKEYAGRQAKLYYYNEDESDFEMVTSALINEEGVAELEYDHASSYVIVINENKDVDTGDSGAGVIWKTLMVLSVMMVATLVYTEKKKSKTR